MEKKKIRSIQINLLPTIEETQTEVPKLNY